MRSGPYPLTLAKLEREPHGVDLGPLTPALPERLRTPDRRIRLAPEAFTEALAQLARELDDDGGAELRAGDALLLIGRRQVRSNNSWMHNVPRLMRGDDRCTLLIHPDDAARRGIGDDGSEAPTRVRITSRVGTIEAPAEISDEVMPGVVSLPHGWGHGRDGVRLATAQRHPGASLNDLTDELRVDALSGNAALSGVPVRVERA